MAGVVYPGGGEGDDIGSGDAEAELVGAVEAVPDGPLAGPSLDCRNRTMVQSSPEPMTTWLMPTSSS